VVITGAGRAFCAGGDLAAIGKGRQGRETQSLEPLLRMGMQAVLKMRMIPQPVIAAVNGAAAGAGMNIALAADMRIAAEEATFGQNLRRSASFPIMAVRIFCRSLWDQRKLPSCSIPAT